MEINSSASGRSGVSCFDESRQPRVEESERPPAYDPPSAKKAAEFWQANLPRRMPDKDQPTRHRLARPGEKITGGGPDRDPPLYGVWGTSFRTLDEFGIGVGLYYRQLVFLGIVITACAIVYIPTIMHNSAFNGADTPVILRGTAHNASRSDLSLNYNGVPDLIVTLMLVMFALVSRKIEKRIVAAIDTSQQTPQDYTVCIQRPPRAAGGESTAASIDMYDPDSYQRVFKQYGEIVFVTVCLKNGALMKAVARKRVIEHKIAALRAQENIDARQGVGGGGADTTAAKTTADLKWWQAWLQKKLGLFATKDYLERSLAEAKELIRGQTNNHPEPMCVYITFNTEQAQRRCLRKVETGLWEEHLARFKKRGVNQNAVIGGKVCRIKEADEPSDIIWENLDATMFERAKGWALSLCLSGLFLTGAFFILAAIFESGLLAAVFIAIINAVLPLVIRAFTLLVEVHKTFTQMQASLMFKLVVARAINSAFLLFIITSDTEQFQSDTLTKIMTILVADAFSGPLLRLTNIPDKIGRYLIGPKQKTQADMNLFYLGALWNLAERYTDMIKTVVVGLFYSALVPTGLFITAGAMFMLYWVDKYSLLRLWKRPPAYDGSLSSQMRHYIILCIWMHLVMARFFFAKWPGLRDEEMPDCNLFGCGFADGEENFFSDAQARIVTIYEVVGVVAFAFGGALVALAYARHYGTKLVIGKNTSVGQASNVRYRDVRGISAYVPMITRRELVDPLLAIGVRDLPPNAHSFLHLHNRETLCMNSKRDFPFDDVSERDRDRLFGTVRYYHGEQQQSATMGAQTSPTVAGGYQRETAVGAAGAIMGMSRFGLTRQISTGIEALLLPAGAGTVQELAGPRRTRGNIIMTAAPWTRPATASSDIYSALRDLPRGWEVKFAGDGRLYYVDNNNRTTQWEHPDPLARYSTGHAGAGVSPAGGTSQIRGRGALHSSVGETSEDGVGRWATGEEKGGRGGGGEGVPHNWEGVLPDHIEIRVSKGSNPRTYYVNHRTRVTSWQPPPRENW